MSLKITGLSKINNRFNSFLKMEKKATTELKRFGRDATQEAKAQHRFTSRTGNLLRSIKWDMPRNNKVDIFIDDVDARYGKWVHDGTKWINEDKFLRKAFMRRLSPLKQRLIGILK